MIVNLKTEDVLSGVLWSTRGPWFTLRKTALLKAGTAPMPVDGDVIIHRDNINFVQVLP